MQTSDRLRTLERLRDRLAEQIDACSNSRDLALLTTRLEAVLVQVDQLALLGDSPVDVIARRRAERVPRGKAVAPAHPRERRGGGATAG